MLLFVIKMGFRDSHVYTPLHTLLFCGGVINSIMIKLFIIKGTLKLWSLIDLDMTHHDSCIAPIFPFLRLQFLYISYAITIYFVWLLVTPYMYMWTTQPRRYMVEHETILDTSQSLSYQIKLHHKHTKDIPPTVSPTKPVWIPRPKGLLPQLVTASMAIHEPYYQ